MRLLPLTALLCCAAGLPGCSGFSIGVRQDKEDGAAFARALSARPVGDRFRAGVLLDAAWTRLFVFPGGVSTQAIEDRIAIPFPQSGEEIPRGASYLVFADAEAVISAFSFPAPREISAACLLAERGPLGPQTQLTLVAAGRDGRLGVSTTAAAARCR